MNFFSSVRGLVARPAGFGRNMLKTLAQMLIMWTLFYALLPMVVYSTEERIGLKVYRFRSGAWQMVGSALFLLGWLLAQSSAVYMVAYGHGTPLPADCPRDLVVVGPYRDVRNPMAIGSIAQGAAVGLWLGSPLVVIYALVGAVGWNYTVRRWEEMDLEGRFGEPYARYRAAVRCWIPMSKPYRASQNKSAPQPSTIAVQVIRPSGAATLR